MVRKQLKKHVRTGVRVEFERAENKINLERVESNSWTLRGHALGLSFSIWDIDSPVYVKSFQAFSKDLLENQLKSALSYICLPYLLLLYAC